MRLWWVVLVPLALAGQDRTGEFSVGGMVVNSQTGEPIKNALVTLSQFGPARGDVLLTSPLKSAFSDPGGGFLFTSLSEGGYEASAEKPGFVADAPPLAPFELKSSINDMRLKLTPLGVIEGQVVDQYGEPLRHVSVIALTVKVSNGFRTTQRERTVPTDDRGYYRLWNLAPGKYYIKAAGRSEGTYSYVGDSAALGDAWEGFAPVYAGGARDLDSAAPVAIEAGTQARADVKITREPAVKIRGVLRNFTPHQTVRFELLQGNEDVSASRSTLNATSGRFEILNVIPGTYLLRATQEEKSRAEAMVTVKDADVDQVALTLAPGVRVTAESGDPQCSVTLHSSERSARTLFTSPGKDGFAIENVLPGEYYVMVQCFGGYATRVMAGNADLLLNPKLTITAGVTPPPIEITAKSGGGTIAGKLVMNPSPEKAAILLIPAFAPSSGPEEADAVQGFDGRAFAFFSLAPGDYVLYAFSSPDEVEFRNPAFLQSLTGGTPVHVDGNEQREITLTSVVK